MEALFASDRSKDPAGKWSENQPGSAGAPAAPHALFSSAGAHSGRDKAEQPLAQEDYDEDDDEGEWTVLQASRPRTQQVRDLDSLGQMRSKSQSPTPRSRSSAKP